MRCRCGVAVMAETTSSRLRPNMITSCPPSSSLAPRALHPHRAASASAFSGPCLAETVTVEGFPSLRDWMHVECRSNLNLHLQAGWSRRYALTAGEYGLHWCLNVFLLLRAANLYLVRRCLSTLGLAKAFVIAGVGSVSVCPEHSDLSKTSNVQKA
jgi:hypothetical protein